MGIFFSYFGAKGRMASLYPDPEHSMIIEPFAGAAGYATRHMFKKTKVILADKSPIICGVWDYLIHATPAEIANLPILRQGQTVEDLGNVPQEAKHFIGFWLTQSQTYPSKNIQSKAYGSGWTPTIRGRTAQQLQYIRDWVVINCSYDALPDEYSNAEATWFIDPPYIKAGKRYKCSAADIDFTALGAWCMSRRGQVFVCEQRGATWLDFKALSVERNASNRDNHEVLWTNKEIVPYAPLFL